MGVGDIGAPSEKMINGTDAQVTRLNSCDNWTVPIVNAHELVSDRNPTACAEFQDQLRQKQHVGQSSLKSADRLIGETVQGSLMVIPLHTTSNPLPNPKVKIGNFEEEAAIPQQKMGDIDQSTYQHVMNSWEQDRSEKVRKLDSRFPKRGLDPRSQSSKYLKNCKALDFDHVSQMQVETDVLLGDLSRSLGHSPNSALRGDSRMVDADAL